MENIGTIATITGTIVAIIALLLYGYIERIKISKLFAGVIARLRRTLGHLGSVLPLILRTINILISALLLTFIALFILIVPFFLYGELILHQPLYFNSFFIDSSSMIYLLIVIVWCIGILTIRYKFTTDELRIKIDYLNRIPGIKELKNKYNKELLDSATRQWDDFKTNLVNNHDDSPFAFDFATCSILDVQDETLIIECPNRPIYNRMNPSIPTDGVSNSEYAKKVNDKRLIEGLVKDRFQVTRISYTLKKQIKT